MLLDCGEQLEVLLWDVNVKIRLIVSANPFMPAASKTAGQFWGYLSNDSDIKKIFEGELFILTLSSTLFQISCEFMLHFKVISKSLIEPDDIGEKELHA